MDLEAALGGVIIGANPTLAACLIGHKDSALLSC